MAKRYNTWFYKFLVSYIMLLMIPLLILGVLFVHSIDGFFEEQVLIKEKNEVTKLYSDIGYEIQTISDIVKQLWLVGVVPDGYDFPEQPLYANQMKRILKTFVIPSSFYDSIIYYQFDQEYLYSSESTCGRKLFFDNMKLEDGTGENLEEQLRGIRIPTSFRVDDGFKYNEPKSNLFLAFPLLDYTGKSEGVVIFVFNESKLTRFIEHILFRNIGYEIRNDNGGLLVSDMTICDEPVREYNLDFDDIDWNLRLYIPVSESVIRANFDGFIPFLVAIIVILVLSGFAIIFFMRHNYRPIGELHETVKGLGTVDEEDREDEFKAIAGTIHKLNSINLDMKNEILNLQEERLNVVLQKLVTGVFYSDMEEFNRECNGLIDISGKYFSFVDLHFKELCSEIENLACRICRGLVGNGIRCYYVYTPYPNRLYLIGNFDRLEGAERFQKRLEPLRAEFEVEYGNVITVGVSSIREGMESIPSLMLEAHSACEYRFIKGQGCVIGFEEINQKQESRFPRKSLNSLKKAILSHDTDSVEASMDELAEQMGNMQISLFEAQGICFEIMQTYMVANPDLRSDGNLRKEMLVFNKIDTAPELMNRIREACRIESPSEEKCSLEDTEVIEKAKEYVDGNCLDCNFSVQDVADSIGMNVTRLSTLFSKVSGECLVDYVSSIRMAEARRLLEKTAMPIKEVSGKVGYYNVSSFIRRFHQIHGISPGDYRKRFFVK